MAKPNLTTIYTSANQYSVLKLLQALCEAVDDIDYTPTSTFIDFKNTVNNKINELETKTNANELGLNTVSSVVENLLKGISSDGKGNISIGKDLEVDGETIYFGGKLLKIDIEPTQTGHIVNFSILKNNEYTTYLSLNSDIENISGKTPAGDGALAPMSYVLLQTNNKQDKLYRHIIQVARKNPDNPTDIGIHAYLIFYSTNNLKADSLQDLTTLLKPTNGYRYPIYPVFNASGTFETFESIGYSNNIWSFYKGDKSVSDIINSVSDIVTTLG